MCSTVSCFFFFFNDTATTEIYTLSLHDALPISMTSRDYRRAVPARGGPRTRGEDRKSTRLNSSHSQISYAVFCLKKKKKLQFGAWRQQDNSTFSKTRVRVLFRRRLRSYRYLLLFFFNDTATTEIYTLSLHDALPILTRG